MGTPMDGAQAPKSSLAGLCVMCGPIPVGSSSLWGTFLSQTPSSVAVGVLPACPSQQLVPARFGDRSHAVMGTRGKNDVPGAKGSYLHGPAPGDLRGGVQCSDTNVTFLLPAVPPANPPGGSAPCLAPRPRAETAAPSASPHTPSARCPQTAVSTPSLPQPCLFLHRSLGVMPCQAPWGATRRAQPPAMGWMRPQLLPAAAGRRGRRARALRRVLRLQRSHASFLSAGWLRCSDHLLLAGTGKQQLKIEGDFWFTQMTRDNFGSPKAKETKLSGFNGSLSPSCSMFMGKQAADQTRQTAGEAK